MQNRRNKRSLWMACLSLPVIWATVGISPTTVGAGPNGTASILDRVQREEDPELSELIRVAVANRKNVASVSEQEVLELVRKVTQSYAQIKLLDQQIEQVAQKLKATAGPAEMQSELVLAKAELESKRTTELANLRETMGVVPRFPLETKPVETLNAWLRLKVIDQRVYVTDALTPFLTDWAEGRAKSLGLLSAKETLDHLRSRLADKANLPIRIDIHQTAATARAAEGLRAAVIKLVYEAGVEMEAEVRLEQSASIGTGTCTYYLRKGEMWALYPRPVRRPDNERSTRLATGRVDPKDLEQHVLWRLLHPGNVPLKFQIEYDEASAELAKQVADTTKAVAKRLGIAELVEVTGVLVEPVPETIFLGRWQAVTKNELQTIEVQPKGVCLLTPSAGSESAKGGATVSCQWFPITKDMIVDVKEKVLGNRAFAYRGHVNPEGNLVIDRVAIYTQGSIHLQGLMGMVFRKVP